MKAKRMPSRYSWRLLGSFLLILGLFMAVQEQNRRIAELEAAEAESRFALAYQAEANGNRDDAVDIVFAEAANGYYDDTLMRELLFGEGLAMRLEGHREEVKAVAVSHDGRFIVSGGGDPWITSYDNRVLVWDIETGEQLAACEGHSDSVTSVAFSPINNTVLSGSRDGTMRLWNWHKDACVSLMIFGSTTGLGHRDDSGQATWIWDVTFTPDGTSVISAGRDGSLILWDVATGQAQHQYIDVVHAENYSYNEREWVNTVAISPDGTYMISGSDSLYYNGSEGNLLIAHSLTDTPIILDADASYIGHSHHVISVAINPANPDFFLSASRDGTVRYWNRYSPYENETNGVPNVFSVAGTETDIQSVAISPDGTMAAIGTGLRDGTGVREIYLWDLGEWHPIDVFEDLNGAVWDLAFSPDGSQLVAAMSDGTVLVWNMQDNAYDYQLSTAEMLEMLANRFGR